MFQYEFLGDANFLFNFNRCPVCKKLYTSVKRLLSHHQKDHPDSEPIIPGPRDAVFVYTISLVTLGLLRQTLRTAIKTANGELIIQIYR